MRSKRPILTILFALMLAAAACGNNGSDDGGDNATNNGTNNATNNGTDNPTNNGTNAGTNNDEAFDNTSAEYQEGYDLRFTTLVFDNQPASNLNGIVEQNLDQNLELPIIVLLEVSSIDAEAGELFLKGGSGVKAANPGEYEWDTAADDEPTLVEFDPETGAFDAQLDQFDFVATFQFDEDVSKVTIPIQGLSIQGNLVLLDGGASAQIPNGALSGYLTKEDGDETTVTLTPGGNPIAITTLFKEENLNYDSTTGEQVEKGSAEADSWWIEASFVAEQTVIIE